MAIGTKLVLEFTDADGKSRTFSYNYVMANLSTATILNLMNGMITNGSIFEYPPVARKSAKLVTTSETTINVDDE